ncbi:hypothetical protein Tco_0800714 [Tanacetum coccineum]|uniref:Uncharacterized protein n=1 Tax=Tanacetum coccineum TaxID=301880 RepID=A0ABQ4ZW97_9ASTR
MNGYNEEEYAISSIQQCDSASRLIGWTADGTGWTAEHSVNAALGQFECGIVDRGCSVNTHLNSGKSSSPVQSSRPITTKVPTKPTECASSYGDFGCLSPNNMTDFEEDEKVFENTRSVTKEDKDEQGKEEKWLFNYL